MELEAEGGGGGGGPVIAEGGARDVTASTSANVVTSSTAREPAEASGHSHTTASGEGAQKIADTDSSLKKIGDSYDSVKTSATSAVRFADDHDVDRMKRQPDENTNRSGSADHNVTESMVVDVGNTEQASADNIAQCQQQQQQQDHNVSTTGGDDSFADNPLNNNKASKSDCSANGKMLDTSSSDIVDLTPGSVNGKRRRHRRRHKGGKHHPRKWKPYDKLTWDERKVLEERECRRATQKRENRFASGQAMAPYNTTQFLMEQHEPNECDLNRSDSRPHRERSASHRAHGEHHMEGGALQAQAGSGGSADGSSDEMYDSEEEIFLEKDFIEAYEQYQAEKLQSMTKDELIKDYMGLECEVEQLKRQLEESQRRLSSESGGGGSAKAQPVSSPAPIALSAPLFPDNRLRHPSGSGQAKMTDLQYQIQALRAENEKLLFENNQLKHNTVQLD